MVCDGSLFFHPAPTKRLKRGIGAMNKSTRVAVCCYAGDGKQVAGALPILLHHECPVVILSPTDEPFKIDHPGVENKTGGLRQYTGQLSLDRQREHMKI